MTSGRTDHQKKSEPCKAWTWNKKYPKKKSLLVPLWFSHPVRRNNLVLPLLVITLVLAEAPVLCLSFGHVPVMMSVTNATEISPFWRALRSPQALLCTKCYWCAQHVSCTWLYVKYFWHLERVHRFETSFKNPLEQYPIPISERHVYLRLLAKFQSH